MADFMYGSINLSQIPKELIRKGKNGRLYLSIKIGKRKEVSEYGDTHFISCEPKDREERVEGVNYFIGDLKEWVPKDEQPAQQTAQPQQATNLDLPF